MRKPTLGVLTIATFLVPLVSASLSADSPAEWVPLVSDPERDAVAAGDVALPTLDPRADIRTIEASEGDGRLGLRLTTAAGESAAATPAASYTLTLSFAYRTGHHEHFRSFQLLADAAGFRLLREGSPVDGDALTIDAGSAPHGFTVWIADQVLREEPTAARKEGRVAEVGDAVFDVAATMHTTDDTGTEFQDRAPDAGWGERFVRLTSTPWSTAHGPNFAAGPSVAIGPDGDVHVAYVVYRDHEAFSTGDPVASGLYHGVLSGAVLEPERVASVRMTNDTHMDDRTTTAVAVGDGGVAHILYHPHPNGTEPPAIAYAYSLGGGGWSTEDPAAHLDGRVDDGYRAVPAMTVGHGRVVAALQLAEPEAVAVVERTGQDAWQTLTTIAEARAPRLALGDDGLLHAAWFHPTHSRSGVFEGELRYASESSGWQTRTVAAGIKEYTAFWEGAEADGTFAMATAPGGSVYFVWEEERDGRYFAILNGGDFTRSETSLVPGHGNPQVRIRMAVDAAGRAHIVSGYGGTDLYAVRGTNGSWYTETIARFDMASFALTPDARPVLAYTEPHGGTTLAVRVRADPVRDGDLSPLDQEERGPLPDDVAVLPLTALVGLLALAGASGLAGIRHARGRSLPRRAWLWAMVGGFSRLAGHDLLEHETRARIVEAVRTEPGRTATVYRRRLDLASTTFYYHVRRLIGEGVLRSAKVEGRILLFEQEPGPEARHLTPTDRRLVRATERAPGLRAIDYARILGVKRRTVHSRLTTLERDDRVRRLRANARDVRWYPAVADEEGTA